MAYYPSLNDLPATPAQSAGYYPSEADIPSEQPKESFGTSAMYAVPRVASDLATGLYHAAQKVPDLYQTAKTEIPGELSAWTQHPLHAAQQFLAGGIEGINNLAQLPAQLAKYGENRLNLLPQGTGQFVQQHSPEELTPSINQLFDQPQYPGESLIRGVGRNLPQIGGATKVLEGMAPAGLLATKNSIKNQILNMHDTLENKASQGFQQVSDEVNKRGIAQIPTDPSTIDQLKDYFPKTKQANSLLDQAKTGDYNALRKIQSDLFTRGKKNIGSKFETDRMRGEEMFEKRDDINQLISNHLKNTGNPDLDNVLNTARNDYKTLQNVYYNPKLGNSLINMFDKNVRAIPNNLVKVLQKDSKPMQNLLNFHPGLENSISKYNLKQSTLGKAVKYGLPAAAAGIGGYEAVKHGSGHG